MDWANAAAFAAAGISLINVFVTSLLVNRLHREEWRRDEIRPVVERILLHAREAHRAWTQAAINRELQQRSTSETTAKLQEVGQERWEEGKAAWDELCVEAARLDLIAAEPVRKAVDDLRVRLESMGLRIRPHRWCPAPLSALEVDIGTPMLDLIASTRAEIGLGREPRARVHDLASWPRRRRMVGPREAPDDQLGAGVAAETPRRPPVVAGGRRARFGRNS